MRIIKKHILGFIIGLLSAAFIFIALNILDTEIRIPKHHVAVKLILDNDKSIELIELKSCSSNQTIWLSSHTETLLIFPNIGEGEFSISCTFKDSTKISSGANYVEGGYSPTLKITDDEIFVLDFY